VYKNVISFCNHIFSPCFLVFLDSVEVIEIFVLIKA
jgi:hypothetical protein